MAEAVRDRAPRQTFSFGRKLIIQKRTHCSLKRQKAAERLYGALGTTALPGSSFGDIRVGQMRSNLLSCRAFRAGKPHTLFLKAL